MQKQSSLRAMASLRFSNDFFGEVEQLIRDETKKYQQP